MIEIKIRVKRTRLAIYLGGIVYIVGYILGFSLHDIDKAVFRLVRRVLIIEPV